MASTARASRSRVDDARASTTLATRRRRRRRRRRASLCRASSRRRIVVSSSSRGVPRVRLERERERSRSDEATDGGIEWIHTDHTDPIDESRLENESLDARRAPTDVTRSDPRAASSRRRRRVGASQRASGTASARTPERAKRPRRIRTHQSAPSDRARHAHRRARVRDDDDVEREV
jgi:hypothetical protein